MHGIFTFITAIFHMNSRCMVQTVTEVANLKRQSAFRTNQGIHESPEVPVYRSPVFQILRIEKVFNVLKPNTVNAQS